MCLFGTEQFQDQVGQKLPLKCVNDSCGQYTVIRSASRGGGRPTKSSLASKELRFGRQSPNRHHSLILLGKTRRVGGCPAGPEQAAETASMVIKDETEEEPGLTVYPLNSLTLILCFFISFTIISL